MQDLEVRLRPGIKIQNTVATAEMGQDIDLGQFNRYRHLSANLDLYRCGYVKDNTMVGRVSVFRNGKMISVGTKSPRQAAIELKKAARIMAGYGMAEPAKLKPQTRNIVARFDLKRRLPIERLARTLSRCMYEPEQFPGLIYRIQDSCVALLFSSGKGVIVGAKSVEEVNSAYFEVQSRV